MVSTAGSVDRSSLLTKAAVPPPPPCSASLLWLHFPLLLLDPPICFLRPNYAFIFYSHSQYTQLRDLYQLARSCSASILQLSHPSRVELVLSQVFKIIFNLAISLTLSNRVALCMSIGVHSQISQQLAVPRPPYKSTGRLVASILPYSGWH